MFFRRGPSADCERSRVLLSPKLDGRLNPSEARALEHHLAGCPACTRELETLRMTAEMLAAIPRVSVPRSFQLRESVSRPATVWYFYLRNASAALAVVFIALLAFNTVLQSTLPGTSSFGSAASVASSARVAGAGQAEGGRLDRAATEASRALPAGEEGGVLAATGPLQRPAPPQSAQPAAAPLAANLEAAGRSAVPGAPTPVAGSAATQAARAPQPRDLQPVVPQVAQAPKVAEAPSGQSVTPALAAPSPAEAPAGGQAAPVGASPVPPTAPASAIAPPALPSQADVRSAGATPAPAIGVAPAAPAAVAASGPSGQAASVPAAAADASGAAETPGLARPAAAPAPGALLSGVPAAASSSSIASSSTGDASASEPGSALAAPAAAGLERPGQSPRAVLEGETLSRITWAVGALVLLTIAATFVTRRQVS